MNDIFMPSDKEIQVMLKRDINIRYQYFIKKVVDWQTIWIIEDDDFPICAGDGQGNFYVALWPARAYAELNLVGAWADYKVSSIPLKHFLNELAPNLKKDNYGLCIFMVPDNSNVALVPLDNVVEDMLNYQDEYYSYLYND
ncbi:DUF2750 domain-containing protein [Bartonella sp. HY329]|uniref:DUF2750 domain-containing protein n=1 Tax=unclassified Bartonella TaxID=2645622 RepID=UPI0021C72516|nr:MULTISPECIES: DUF2750 domain-containing protein [unclassified Bartonella]UXM95830.1 DUF2750 domain-containing protein [Bartonella sp. HY329]UXN10155.1 DUF2750 domain-containing protein [Bartonella sp. HY328]